MDFPDQIRDDVARIIRSIGETEERLAAAALAGQRPDRVGRLHWISGPGTFERPPERVDNLNRSAMMVI